MRPYLSILLLLLAGLAQAQITYRPYVEERYTRRAEVTRVELTDQYTIIDMQYSLPRSAQPLNPRLIRVNTIQIDPRSRLYRPRDTSRRYGFIRAEGIPVSPETRTVFPGETVRFRLYYERLEPGIEIFDLYEGRNPDPARGEDPNAHEFWNTYGIHIKNPLPPRRNTPRPATPPVDTKPIPPSEKPTAVEPPPSQAPAPQPPAVETSPPVSLAGTVFDATTRQPVAARLRFAGPADTVRLDVPTTGSYRLTLDRKSRYTLWVEAKGYLISSLTVSLADSGEALTFNRDIYLTPLTEGATVALDNVYFATSRYELLPESFAELDNLLAILKENPGLRIRIEGHTDKLGDFDKNVELSRNRATAVRDYLIRKGIDPVRLDAKGYGPTRPVSQGNTEAERLKNRRVEFFILSR